MAKKKVESAPIVRRSPIVQEGADNGFVKSVVGELNSKFGKGSAMLLSEGDDMGDMADIPFWVRTGIPQLDYAVGGSKHPGFPGGRITEVFGAESAGKTTVSLWIMKKLVESGGIGIYQDSEFALTEERAEQMQIDLESIIYTQPEIMEEVFEQQEAVIDLLRKKKDNDQPVGIFWDSVASCPTKSELDGEYGDSVMGIHARLMSQSLRKIRGKIKKEKILALYVNQIRDKIGISYGDKTATFGGRALKFYASVRIQVTQQEKIKVGDKIVGIRVKAEVKKNKVAPPFKSAVFDILFFEEGGIDQNKAILDWLKENELIGGSQGWYEIGGKNYRLDDAKELLADDEELFQEYLDLCYTV